MTGISNTGANCVGDSEANAQGQLAFHCDLYDAFAIS